MRTLGIVQCVLFLTLQWGCRKDDTPATPESNAAEAEKSEAPPGPSEGPAPAAPALPLPTHVRVVTVDQTSADERPTNMSERIQGIAEKAAEAAGFTVVEDGHLLGVEVFYMIAVDGKADPNAERGTIAWGVSTLLALADEDGLVEELTSRRGDERPFVRAALPDLKAAFASVLSEALESALRDVAMQIAYREATAERCHKGMRADHSEERHAAMRRLGELRHKDSAQKIIDAIESADELTVALGIGVLGRIRNPVAVKPLAKLAEGPDPQRAMLVVTAIAAIGGPEARRYLRLIGASHPSPVVQKTVEDLLADDGEGR